MNSFLLGLRRRPSNFVATALASATISMFVLTYDEEHKNSLWPSSSMCEVSPSSTQSISNTKEGPKLIFLGSGSSMGCPVGICTFTLKQALENATHPNTPKCDISHLASRGDPKYNKNYRNNPSFLIHSYDSESKTYKNIIIDVGKTFREGALRWFPEFQIESLDAIILTHEHMDAAAGLDDVRGFQRYDAPPIPLTVGATSKPPRRIPVPIYLSQHCYDILQGQYPFLLPKKVNSDKSAGSCCSEPSDLTEDTSSAPSKPIVHRDVAGFSVNIFQSYKAMNIEGLDIIPLPVWHGDDLISYGFAFSIPSKDSEKSINVVYLSDISRMVPETMDFIQNELPPTDILVVDALLWRHQHPTHFSLEQAVELRDQIQPRLQTFLVGMSCENYPPHEQMETYLKSTYGNVTMAHDGLSIPLD